MCLLLFAPILFDESFAVLGLAFQASHALHSVVVGLDVGHALTFVAHVGFLFLCFVVGDVDPKGWGEVLSLDACHYFAIIEVETIT